MPKRHLIWLLALVGWVLLALVFIYAALLPRVLFLFK